MRPSLVGPRLLNAAICSALPALESSRNGFAGYRSGHAEPYVKIAFCPPCAAQVVYVSAASHSKCVWRSFSLAPTVITFLAVPGALIDVPSTMPSPSASVPELPAEKVTARSRCDQMNASALALSAEYAPATSAPHELECTRAFCR